MRFVSLLGVVLAVGVVLALGSAAASARPAQAVPAAAHKDLPVRFYTLSRIDATTGKVTVAQGSQQGGRLHKRVHIGHTPFNLLQTRGSLTAFDDVFSSADGSDYSVLTQSPTPTSTDPGTPRGGVSHLDEFQAYRKRSGNASLLITITKAMIHAVDTEHRPSGCPPPEGGDCPLLRGIVRLHARAYAASADGDFFNVGATAFLEGHRGAWYEHEATDADSWGAVWDDFNFDFVESFDKVPHSGKHHKHPQFIEGPEAVVTLDHPLQILVPLDSVRDDELFAVHVTLEVQATDDRAGETSLVASIDDPQHLDAPLLKTHGLQLVGKPRFPEPKATRPPAAGCPAGPSPRAGRLQLSSPAYTIGESDGFPTVVVTRTGGSRGEISATVRTKSGSAKAGQDFKATTTRVTFNNHDTSPRFVEIPIREDQAAESPENFTVSLSHPQCGKLGKQKSATVTIIDDDQPPPPPAPTFTIGGVVDGLQGSGLVLTNLGTDVPVSGDGTFTFPVTAISNQPYEVIVKTQPSNPTQVCTVVDGKGTVNDANVTNVAVHCAAPFTPLGLDTSFGTGGLVSTPVGGLGQAEAVVIDPNGGILSAGWRTVGTLGATDFAVTRHDDSGSLDHSFGTDGIATTDLGGDHDQAFGAAVLRDNSIVAVGRTNALGILKTAFGLAGYSPDGKPNQNFGTGGIVTTPFAGKGAGANAVAVQQDGKIVVAGFAFAANGIDSDFAVARYNADGSLDDGFGAHGIATADVGGENDDATGLALQSDGKIVLGGVTGPTGEDVGLARFEPNGTLDPTFGNLGTSDVKIGLGVEVKGVALQSGGGILIAGSMFSNTSMSRDFLLAGFRNDGTLNLGFGHFGFVTTDFGEGDDFAENLVVDDQDHVVLVGRAASGTIEDLALAGYKPDGSPDDLGRGGIFTADFHGRGDFGQDLVIDSQNRIIAAGGTSDSSGTEFALTRVFR
jgi:uncharacterized delta-60 repeat protein